MRWSLIENWRSFWKLWSIRLNAIGLAIIGWVAIDPVGVLYVWNLMPHVVRDLLPAAVLQFIGIALFVLSMIARLVRQPKLEKSDATSSE